MSLSKAQTSLYWRTWSSVCIYMGWKNSDSKLRYALHAEAHCAASMTDFENSDLDRYLRYCDGLLGHERPARVSVQGDRNRTIWRIKSDAKRAGFSDEYLAKIAHDLTGGFGTWEELQLPELEKFRNTISNRARGKVSKKSGKKSAKKSTPELVTSNPY